MSAAAPHELPGATREQAADLETFRRMLVAANAGMNLVGAATLDDFWRRHVLDSAQLLKIEPEARVWADLGSGAGLPGVVLAILLKDEGRARVHLVESVTKKCDFLADVAAALCLPVEIHNARAETLRLKAEVVTARACAPLTRLLGFAAPFLRRGARGLFLKGEALEDEIALAQKTWRFACEILPSLSDPRGRILSVRDLARVR